MSFDFQQHTLLFGRLFASRSSKSPDSYHAIIPIYVDICPAVISVENTKASGKSQLKSFTYSSVLLYMEEKLTCFVESSGSFFKRLISNAAAQSSKKSTTFAVDVRWENECEGCKINKPRFWLAGSLVDGVLGWEIVFKISHLLSKLRFSAKYWSFGQSFSRAHYQPPEGVDLPTSVKLLNSAYLV